MPVDRGAIDAQLREIGEGERWWDQREFRALPHILHADERITGLINGKVLGARRPRIRPTGQWLLVATNLRLICLKQERFARKHVEFASGQIARVHQSSRLRTFQITVDTPQGRYRLRIPKADAFRFVGALAPLAPSLAAQPVEPGLVPWADGGGMQAVTALPGVGGIISRMAMLSSPDYAARDHIERLEANVERLQADLERLQEQVTFLEELLQKRSEEAFLARPRSGV